jgi:hypothetical protein
MGLISLSGCLEKKAVREQGKRKAQRILIRAGWQARAKEAEVKQLREN